MWSDSGLPLRVNDKHMLSAARTTAYAYVYIVEMMNHSAQLRNHCRHNIPKTQCVHHTCGSDHCICLRPLDPYQTHSMTTPCRPKIPTVCLTTRVASNCRRTMVDSMRILRGRLCWTNSHHRHCCLGHCCWMLVSLLHHRTHVHVVDWWVCTVTKCCCFFCNNE